MAKSQRDAAKEAFWRDMLKRFATSDLSVREFCKQERERCNRGILHSGVDSWNSQFSTGHGEVCEMPKLVGWVRRAAGNPS